MRRPLRIALAVLALPVLVLVGAFLYGAVLGLTGRWEPAPEPSPTSENES